MADDAATTWDDIALLPDCAFSALGDVRLLDGECLLGQAASSPSPIDGSRSARAWKANPCTIDIQ